MREMLGRIAATLAATRGKDSPGRAAAQARLARAVARFQRDERGSLMVFGLMMLVLMIMVAGISVDLMHFETKRAQIQTTLDNAVLAAANLNQTLDPTAVVTDYFSKAGLAQYLSTITANKTISSSKVTANAEVSVPTSFMHMMGIDNLQASSASTAQETIGAVEIALVLDNSGSMADSSKIQNLRIAGQQFVDTMFSSVDPGKLMMSVVSYSAQANIGPDLMAQLTTTNQQTTASCIDFQTSDFLNTQLSLTSTLPRTSQFDAWDNFVYYNRYTPSNFNTNGSTLGYHTCPLDNNTAKNSTDPSRRSIFFSSNQTALDSMINNMQATDNTSIDVGMKWGAVSLDPSMQPIVTNLIGTGYASAAAAGRPAAYSDGNTAKVIVVMTDGENTTRPSINAPYISGPSTIWYNATANSYSMYDATKNKYWSTATKTWISAPYGNTCNSSFAPVTTTSSSTNTSTSSTSATKTTTVPPTTSSTGPTTTVNSTTPTTSVVTTSAVTTTISYALKKSGSSYSLVKTTTAVTNNTIVTTPTTCTSGDPGYPNGAVQWDWTQVWNVFPVMDFMDGIYAPAYSYSTSKITNSDGTTGYSKAPMNTMFDAIQSQQSETQMDTNLHNICAAAKANGVTVYSIGFLTTTHGASVLTDCATSPAYYFNVTSSPNISAAFAAIATNINLLRLTQ